LLTGAPASEAELVVGRIERQMRRDGDRLAVRCGEATLTRRELDDRSAALARRLISSGVERGDRVIVTVPRSVELVVAIVGAMRAGAAYVPIDPAYPLERNRVIARAARARAIVAADADHGLAIDVPAVAPMEVSPAVDPAGRTIELPKPGPDDPAYVIYTSGSTGSPRGVVVAHRELASSTAARDDVYPSSPTAFLVVSSAAFDSSVAGLFWALTTGGVTVLPTDDEVHDIDALVDLVAVAEVSHVLLVPSLYRGMLSRAEHARAWPEQVIVAGEACGPDLVAAHFATHPASRLANEYGPTEATVWVTVAQTGRSTADVPIGAPIPGVWTAVVDHSGELAPVGVVGELVIGGTTVTAGYDTIESDRFLVESHLGPGRAFRTGDLAAVVDGQLYYHGRQDDQLNVGGIRVEPAEIEAAIEAVDGIDTAVVIARDLRPLDHRIANAAPARLADAMRRSADAEDPADALAGELADAHHGSLVAHVEAADEVDLGRLRTELTATLPATMRPTVVRAHQRLPRLPNGKLDREAIATLPVAAPTRSGFPGGTHDGVVELLIGYFGEVLGRDDIGPDTDFFDEGGDSLLALELLIRLERRFGIRPRVSILLDARTPRAIAAALDLGGDAPGPSDETALVLREGTADQMPLWLWPGADGVPLLFTSLIARMDPGLRVLTVEYPGTRGERPPFASVEEIGEYCHRALVAAQPDGPYRMLGYSVGGLVAVDVARRLLADGREVEYVGAIEAGLAGVSDPRGRAAKVAGAWRERGARFAAQRMVGALRLEAKITGERLRTGIEGWAIQRFGLRPSDRLLFQRMKEQLGEAGLRYRPPAIDADVRVYLGADASDHWLAAMTREWGAVAGDRLLVEQVDGSHVDNSILHEPDVGSLAVSVSAALGLGR
ncbi:MAG: amino acid adenylation domain-containing protein, partial [Ilumatobacteraceae bacterium]